MNILMLGWEFPPHISGGLGTACYGLTKGLSLLGAEVLFALPRPTGAYAASHVRLLAASRGASPEPGGAGPISGWPGLHLRPLDVALSPYAAAGFALRATPDKSAGPDRETLSGGSDDYGRDLFSEVRRYVDVVSTMAAGESFDVIHAHDWMTFPAAAAVAERSGKPLVVHVHSTEFDRSGDGVNQAVYEIEREGMRRADRVITVSRFTKRLCVERYGVPEDKVSVVYNAVAPADPVAAPDAFAPADRIVLFLGRITMQKGPEYFLAAARKVLEKVPEAKFVMAGAGDKFHDAVELAAGMGIGHRVLFAGFLRGDEVARAFRMAAVYVMPSVSEPFGIAPLEALAHGVPVIISKQSGVAEVLSHALKVDFWDIHEMANKIISVLRHPVLREALRENGSQEVRKFDWLQVARRCLEVYEGVFRLAR
jgi:glycogen(starch) synthase